ncbi:MAG TPA: nucleoside 2-deoxyribosyltransferase [Thermoanaerobaculia bacterium]|nr:nucleoside 2-deoxyribosyltransferase [Thermoanaerobaculia bacterium]
MGQTIYWAGPLFTQAERMWNRRCADELRTRGFTVVLPQEEATAFMIKGKADLKRIAENCYQQAITSDILVAVLDGADCDSGTGVEIGLRIGDRKTPSRAGVIGVLTDFRVIERGGPNAMLTLVDDIVSVSSLHDDLNELISALESAILRLSR